MEEQVITFLSSKEKFRLAKVVSETEMSHWCKGLFCTIFSMQLKFHNSTERFMDEVFWLIILKGAQKPSPGIFQNVFDQSA